MSNTSKHTEGELKDANKWWGTLDAAKKNFYISNYYEGSNKRHRINGAIIVEMWKNWGVQPTEQTDREKALIYWHSKQLFAQDELKKKYSIDIITPEQIEQIWRAETQPEQEREVSGELQVTPQVVKSLYNALKELIDWHKIPDHDSTSFMRRELLIADAKIALKLAKQNYKQ